MPIKPTLTRTDLSMIVVSFVIGIGIFRTPAIVAQKAGSPELFFAAWILGGLISICGALTFAEIGARFPVAGGFYKIFSSCYHPVFAFMLNWSLVIINSFSAVGVALVGAEYITPVVFPAEMQTQIYVQFVALLMILILFGLNFAGIKTGARAQNILSGIKIAMILFFSSAVLFSHPSVAPVHSAITASGSFMTILGISLISVFFTYGGYQNTMNLGADVKDPQRTIPASIFTGMGIVMVLYLLINFAYVHVLGFENVQQSKLLAAELASSFLGDVGYKITSVAIFISVMGFINTSLMSNPRIYYAMADDGILPEIFKRVNEKTQVQQFALSFFTALMILGLIWLGTFEKIVNYVMFIDSFSMVTAAATIFIFRKRMKDMNYTGFKLRLFPWIPLIFMAMLLSVTYNVFISDVNAAITGLCIFAAGYPLYYLLKKISNSRSDSTIT
ncbi:MAG: amino acid permease [Bacteroidota bacterium]